MGKIKKEKYDVFLSYRSDRGQEAAMLIQNALNKKGYRVFLDLNGMHAGAFDEQLCEIIDNSTDFLLILSPRALDRCENDQDWVRREIERAKAGKKNIVPIMMDGFEFPQILPESIDFVRYLHSPEFSHSLFKPFMDLLSQKYLLSKPRKTKRWFVFLAVIVAAMVVLFVCRPVPSFLPKPAPSIESQVGLKEETTENSDDSKETVSALPTPTPTSTLTLTLTGERLERFVGDIDEYQRIFFSGASQSSNRDDNSTAESAADDNKQTAWIEGTSGGGIEEYAVLRFPEKTRVDLIGISTDGLPASDELLRPKSLEFRFSDGETAWCGLPDENRTVLFALDEPVHTKSITVIIKEVWPESGTGNTALSEVTAYSLRGPSAADLDAIGAKIFTPNESDYLETYHEAVITSEKGHSIFGYVSPNRGDGTSFQIPDGTPVTVLAKHNDMACVIFELNGKKNARWIGEEHLEPRIDME